MVGDGKTLVAYTEIAAEPPPWYKQLRIDNENLRRACRQARAAGRTDLAGSVVPFVVDGDDVFVVETPLAQFIELLLAFFDKLAADL